ncbi:hypothetical protein ACFQL4_14750 [Halosimplex aquaticum]
MDPEYRDRAVFVDGTLVLADLHFGKAEASTVEFPIGAGDDCVERLEGLLDHFDPDEVVLAGDVFHSFSSVPDSADAALSGISRAVRGSGLASSSSRGTTTRCSATPTRATCTTSTNSTPRATIPSS